MFVGAGSGSTASGIKVTTLTVLLATVWAQLKGKSDVVLFRRRLVTETILKAFTLAVISIWLVIGATFILSMTESG